MIATGRSEWVNGARALAALRTQLRAATLRAEAAASDEALADLTPAQEALDRASVRAARWVEAARADQRSRPLVERMLEQFPLDSPQGKALMSLAEALLRTPDPKRADQLIAERLATMRQSALPQDMAVLLRTGFVLLGAAGRLLPNVTAFGLSLGAVVGGSILVEGVFSYPGLGNLLYLSVINHDFPLMQALFLVISVTMLVAIFVVDLLYAVIDPRVKASDI